MGSLVLAGIVWAVSMLPPLMMVAAMSCGMHAIAEGFVRANMDASWSAAGFAMGMASVSLVGIGCSGLQMAIRVFAVMGAALCLAGWVFAHSEIALHSILQSTHRTVVHFELATNDTVHHTLVCAVRGVRDSILLAIAAQRTVEFWKTMASNIAALMRVPPLGFAAIAAIAAPPTTDTELQS